MAGHISRILVILKKIKNVGNIPENAILVTADVVGLYLIYHITLVLKLLVICLK